jgi:ABC-type nitrate/sulfonate/bicarbonate transport system permease component
MTIISTLVATQPITVKKTSEVEEIDTKQVEMSKSIGVGDIST